MSTSRIIVMPPKIIESVNIYNGWYESDPVVGRKTFMPVVVLPVGEDPAAWMVEPNTVILRMIEN